ncbi:MAG: hypothetical protein ACYDHU_12365 [Acidimicrobiales bacterium]
MSAARRWTLVGAAALVLVGVTGAILVPVLAGSSTKNTTSKDHSTKDHSTKNHSTKSRAPSPSASALLADSLGAADRQRSVHFVATSTLSTKSIVIVANAGTTSGTQAITIRVSKKTGHITGRYTGATVYFRGDAVGLESYLGMPSSIAPTYAGRWISFTSSDQNFTQIAGSMTLKTAVEQVSVSPPVTNGGRAKVNGTSVVVIRGTTTSLSSKGQHGSAVADVASGGAHLPVRFVGTGRQGKQSAGGRVSFSRWGLKVNPRAPSGAVPASSITVPTSGSGSSSSSSGG